MNETTCEECGADLITEDDPQGTGTYCGGDHGWCCTDCATENLIEE